MFLQLGGRGGRESDKERHGSVALWLASLESHSEFSFRVKIIPLQQLQLEDGLVN